jgi:excisionase family DNA binding protein
MSNVEEVAAHSSVNKDSTYRCIEKRSFPSHCAGRLFRFKLSEVDDWVKQGGGNEQRKEDAPR